MQGQRADLNGARLLLLTTDPRLRQRLSMLLPNWGLRVTDGAKPRRKRSTACAPALTQRPAVDLRRGAGRPHQHAQHGDRAASQPAARARDVRRRAPWSTCMATRNVAGRTQRRPAGADPVARQAPDPELRAIALIAAPRRALRRRAAPDHRRRSPRQRATPRRHWQARVLLVEDNPVNLMVAQRLIELLGLECDTADNGEAALLRMRDGRLRPGADGLPDAGARRLHRRRAMARASRPQTRPGPHLPIVAMTANAMAGDRQSASTPAWTTTSPSRSTARPLEHCLRRWLQRSPRREARRPPSRGRPFARTGACACPQPARAAPSRDARRCGAMPPASPPIRRPRPPTPSPRRRAPHRRRHRASRRRNAPAPIR